MNEEIKIVRLADAKPQRWRNDGGWTREIARHGDGDHWQWRLSLAEVESDGPFSAFPGIEREIVLLSGAGMALEFADGERFTLTPESPRLRFSGERALESRLLEGPTSDFNLMWSPAHYQADLWLRPLVGASTLFAEPGETWVLHMLVGTAQLQDMAVPPLERGDTLMLRAAEQRCRQRFEATGSAIMIRLRPVQSPRPHIA